MFKKKKIELPKEPEITLQEKIDVLKSIIFSLKETKLKIDKYKFRDSYSTGISCVRYDSHIDDVVNSLKSQLCDLLIEREVGK